MMFRQRIWRKSELDFPFCDGKDAFVELLKRVIK